MSLNLFFTLQSLPGANGLNVSQGALSPGGNGALQGPIQGMSFIDFILARLSENAEDAKNQQQSQEHDPLASKNPLLDKNPKLDIVEILAASPEIAEQVERDGETFGLDLMTQIAETLHLNQQAIDSMNEKALENLEAIKVTPENLPQVRTILESLLIEGEEPEKGTPAKTALENIISVLERLVESDSPAAIVVNLTPEQITQIKDKIAALQAQTETDKAILSTETDQATDPDEIPVQFSIALVTITPPQESKPQTDIPLQTAKAAFSSSTPASDLAARLNALLVGEKENGVPLPFSAPEESAEEFKNLIQQYAGNKPKADLTNAPAAQTKTPAASANLAALQNWQFDSQGAFTIPASYSEGSIDGVSAAPLSSPAHAASLVTQVQSAGHAHPATQMIAASLQRNAAGGENRHFTLQLDPPELGRIEVRMDFGKDKVLKTHMVIEKPETFVMLQRDGHALERALQDLGLDGDSSLSFELAAEGHEFSHNGGHEGHGGTGSGNAADGDIEIIETAMEWYIDPESGLMRYDFTV